MDGKGGCCIARYAGNAYDLSRMDRIMLRFRPIAPKPAANSSCSGKSDVEMSNPSVEKGRGKRRYVRNRKKRNDNSSDGSHVSVTKGCKFKKNSVRRKTKSSSPEENESDGRGMGWFSVGDKEMVVTLPLLPETPGATKDYSAKEGFFSGMEKKPLSLSFGSEEYSRRVGGVGGGGFWMDNAVAPVKKVVGTWVNVECITGTWVDGYEYGYGYGGIALTDMEKLMSLERDACPGFVSDGSDRVVWVNRAYKEMVVGGGGDEAEEVLVWLVMKEGLQLPPKSWPGFTCSVGVVTCGKAKSSRTLPCDVWRLEGGHGFAWRLDIKTALSL